MSTECSKQRVDVPVRSDQTGIGCCATWDPGKFAAVGFLACWLVKQVACIKWLYSLLKDLLLKTVTL